MRHYRPILEVLDERPSHQGVVPTNAAPCFLISGHLNHERYKHIEHVLFRKRRVRRQFLALIAVDQGRVNLKLDPGGIGHVVNF